MIRLQKHICYLLILCIYTFNVVVASNEWINFSQSYYKMELYEEGFYRITYEDLLSSNIPIQSIDPRKFQIFLRGQELAIYVEGQNDASFDPTDYILFYGKGNDGTLDQSLYVEPEAQPHPYLNNYSDTSAYFLTWKLNNEQGKRMSIFSENNVDQLPAEPFHWGEELLVLHDQYVLGRSYPIGKQGDTFLSAFDYGEGWTGKIIGKDNFIDYELTGIEQMVADQNVNPNLEVQLAGRNDREHDATIFVGSSIVNLNNWEEVSFSYYGNELIAKDISWDQISDSGTLSVRAFVNGIFQNTPDFVSVNYIKLRYPRNFDMQESDYQKFILNINNNKSYIEVTNTPLSAKMYDITDNNNIIQIEHTLQGSTMRAIVPNTDQERIIWVNDAVYLSPTFEKVQFREIDPDSHDYYIVSHKDLMATIGDVTNPVEAYAAYRASDAGGGHDTIVVSINQLYDQFSYGEYSPLAIRRFAEFMYKADQEQYIFLIGKGVYPNARSNQVYYRWDKSQFEVSDLVPTGGIPGSDNVFTAGLDGGAYYPAIPIGRLNATTPDQVTAYLNKVIEIEATNYDALWRKKLIHLSGGTTESELNRFRNNVDDFKQIAIGDFLGGNVVTVNKKTDNASQLINISDEVNDGALMITFFGHSSTTITDIDIGYVSDEVLGYQNAGKYPFILVNGCNAGDIFTSTYTFGEDWVLTPNVGATGFMAHTSAGFEAPLKLYTDIFYHTAFGDTTYSSYPLGAIIRESGKEFLAQNSNDAKNITQIQQMVLQGDPIMNVFGPSLPDYETNNDQVFVSSTDGEPITALTSSFELAIITRNFGRVDHDSIPVQVKRTLPNGQTLIYDSLYKNILYQDTLYITITNPNQEGFGNNRFEIYLDPANQIPEWNEQNNNALFNYFIPLAGTANLFPRKFSIVSEQPVNFIAQSTDVLSDARDFLFELDTIDTFDSPFKKQFNVNAKVLAQWTETLMDDTPNNDSIVYYWRTKFAVPDEGEFDDWTLSSFIYIKGSPPGWSQSHFPQFNENDTSGIARDHIQRKWKFEQGETTIQVKTFGGQNPADYTAVEVHINGTPYIANTIGGFCTTNTINTISFNQINTIPNLAEEASIVNRRSCGRTPQIINNYTENEIQTDLLLDEYLEGVAQGDYVLLFSIGTVNYPAWPTSTKNLLNSIGISTNTIENLASGQAFIALGKKGDNPGTAIVLTSVDLTATLDFEESISGKANSGIIKGPKIGPSSDWGTFFKKVITQEAPNGTYQMDILGITPQGAEEVLFADIKEDELDISSISTESYPYLRLRIQLDNEIENVPAQLTRWQVIYNGVPEGILLLGDDQAINMAASTEGEEVEANFKFINISNRDFADSLTVQTTIFNQSKRQSEVQSFKITPLASGEQEQIDVSLPTLGQVGVNDLNVYVNPEILPELHYYNNIIDLSSFYEIKGDSIHPILDVAFDGVHIMDGDIVSPSPMITVRMKDENELLFKTDTVGIDLFMKKPCEGCALEKIRFTDPNLTWTPASKGKDYNLTYHPKNLEDGIYTLQAQVADASGNLSGTNPYQVRFEIVNESKITHFFPYPNPFSTQTRFVFTLTGTIVPDEIKIQIMTVTGKIVREITQDEIGPVHVGNNISQYAWDGRDEFGDQLANGVYLYKVIVRSEGEHFENRQTAADQAFKNGLGKMYILR